MSAIVGQEWRNKTLRELFVQWQLTLLETWNHTAHIKSCFADKKTNFHDLHPYLVKSSSQQIPILPRSLFSRETEKDGVRISIMPEMTDRGQS